MSLFACKNLQNKPTAVSILKETRLKMGLSLNAVSKNLSIAPRFVENLEESRYTRLPGAIYIKNFIRKYAGLLKLDAEEIIKKYEEERAGGFQKKEIKQFVPVCQIHNSALLLRKIIVASLVLFLVMYLGLEVWGIFKAPPLNLESPLEGEVTLETFLTVRGLTNPEMKVQINGVETVSNSEGMFAENVNLNPGSNQIVITATNKHGRSKTFVRNVIYREKKEDVSLK